MNDTRPSLQADDHPYDRGYRDQYLGLRSRAGLEATDEDRARYLQGRKDLRRELREERRAERVRGPFRGDAPAGEVAAEHRRHGGAGEDTGL